MTEQAQPAGNPSAQPGAQSPVRKQPLNEIIRSDGAKGRPSSEIPEHISQHYVQDGRAYKSAYRQDKIEFIDRGDRLHAYKPVSTFTMRAMAEIAEHRGWKSMEVTGVPQFKQGIYVEAASRNMQVSKGYEPTERDGEILQRRQDRKAAEQNPMVKAYLEADTVKAKNAAVKQYPELKEAFNETKKAETVAESIDSKRAAANFVGRYKDSVAIALHTGREIPKVAGVEAKQTKTAEQPQPDQDKGRSR